MKRVMIICAAAAMTACAAPAPTYRDLDKLGQDYERGAIGAPAPPQDAEQATARDTCGAARFAALVGTPAEAMDRAALPPGARVITPDMMVTMDFSPERLNVMVGADGKVGALRCF